MATEPTLEPTTVREEEEEESDGGEESDVYEIEGEDGDAYQPGEDEDDEADEGEYEAEPENLTAQLLPKRNGTTTQEDEEEEDDDDDEYDEDGRLEGTEENPGLSPVVAGSKRGVGELDEECAHSGEKDEQVEGETVAKKARV